MFRDGSEGFDSEAVEMCDAMAPVLATALSRITRVHHRHFADFEDDEESAAA